MGNNGYRCSLDQFAGSAYIQDASGACFDKTVHGAGLLKAR
jgi:hypothetical protein